MMDIATALAKLTDASAMYVPPSSSSQPIAHRLPSSLPPPVVSSTTIMANYDEQPSYRSYHNGSPQPGSPSTNAMSNGKHPTTSSITVASVDDLSRTHGEVEVPDDGDNAKCFSWRTLWAFTGPGWLMSIAYLDPGNLEADLQAGAFCGYELIWVLFTATCLGLLIQIMAARLGVVTGSSLAEVCRQEYPRSVSILLWIMTELAIIGSDIQEVIGSAIAFKLLFGLPLWAGALITAADTFTFLALHAFGIRKLEAFFAVLIFTMAACFWVDFGASHPSGSGIAHGFLPYVSSYAVVKAVGLLGAVIMPHNIYLHSALVKSRDIDRTRPAKVSEANKYFAIESAVALGVSFIINLAVVSVFAKGFFDPVCAEDGTAMVDGSCQSIGLMEAGDALHDLLGGSARTVWAIGLLAAGQSSTMTGTYAGQFVMEGFLKWQIAPWKRVAITRSIALIPALTIALVTEDHPEASDEMGEWLNVLQSVQLPFALLPILHFTSSKKLMGQFANGPIIQTIVWLVALGALTINVYLVVNFITDPDSPTPHDTWFFVFVSLLGAAYFAFIGVIVWEDVQKFRGWLRAKIKGTPEEDDARLLATAAARDDGTA